MNTRLRHALLASGLAAALVGSLTVTSTVASAGPMTPAAAPLPPMTIKQAEVIRPLPEPWQAPVRGFRITGQFGASGSNWSSTHTGLDFAAGYGTPIHAITSGVVTEAAYDGSYGNKTVVTLENGTEVWYCHQVALAVDAGQRVASGQVIGAVGMTGNTTGPHVHIEVRPGGGDPIDPAAVLEGHRVVL
ncbi:MAG TPA: M23 family metallopeptidase [Nocardioides sp.]|nr:M23 family metallopeptidase [Nocardioides sp.]